jgi:hypothetical protein
MNFGQALYLIKHGQKVRRSGWNGKGMYIYLLQSNDPMFNIHFEPCICMFTAQQKHQPGWLASQPDMLADDWEEVTE